MDKDTDNSNSQKPTSDKKIRRLIRQLFRQGLTPKQLALAISLGATIGISPFLGFTTIMCIAAAAAFKLNHPLTQAVNYLVTSIEILLFIPFLRLGEWLTGTTAFEFNRETLSTMLEMNFIERFELFGKIILLSGLGWLVLTPAISFLIYVVAHFFVQRSVK